MGREKWSRQVRAALAAWAIVSAVLSPLIAAYKFLSARGHLVPDAPESTGTLTIVVNMCIFAALLTLYGLFTGILFAEFSRRERWPRTIGVTIFGSFLILILFAGTTSLSSSKQGDYVIGTLVLVAVLLSLSPMGRWINEHVLEAITVWGMLFVLLLFLIPGWMQGLWQDYSDQSQSHFTIIPLSQMGLGRWVVALVGLGVYVGAFIGFQQWRTEGKWLRDIKDRFRHSS